MTSDTAGPRRERDAWFMKTSRDPVADALEPGERVVWRERAKPGPLLVGQILPLLVFGGGTLLLGSVVVMGAAGVVQTLAGAEAAATPEIPIGGVLLATAFLLIFGLGLLGALLSLLAVGSTHYVLTDKRVLIASPFHLSSYGPAAFEPMRVSDETIAFDWGPRRRRDDFRAWLVGLDDARRVAALIQITLRARR